MHPYLFQIRLPGGGVFRAPSYGFMILLGFLLCLWLLQKRARRQGLNPTALFDAAVVALFAGIVGARLFYVVDNWELFTDRPLDIVRLDKGGLAFFGGLIGGAGGLLWHVWRHKLPLRRTLGVAASLVPLGHAFGRVGCFLNGCCHGKVTDVWTAVRFPRVTDVDGSIIGSPAFINHLERGLVSATDTHSLPVHPTQLYEVAYNLVIFAGLSYLLPRQRRAGDVAWVYAMAYGGARFVNEFFRGDTYPIPALGGLTIFQLIALGAVVFGAAMLGRSLRLPPEPQPEPWSPQPMETTASQPARPEKERRRQKDQDRREGR